MKKEIILTGLLLFVSPIVLNNKEKQVVDEIVKENLVITYNNIAAIEDYINKKSGHLFNKYLARIDCLKDLKEVGAYEKMKEYKKYLVENYRAVMKELKSEKTLFSGEYRVELEMSINQKLKEEGIKPN